MTRFKDRLWWLDVVYPLALAAILFTSLTYIVYAGQRQSRMSLQAERRLLEFSLRQVRGRQVRAKHQVLVVSADPFDVISLGRAPFGVQPDADADSYAKVVGKLSENGVGAVVVRWDAEAHPKDEVYYLPLITTLKRLAGQTRVYLSTPSEAYDLLPAALRAVTLRADDDLCGEADDVMFECTYLQGDEYKDWVVQRVLHELGDRDDEPVTGRRWLSTELSSVFPRYILNLSAPTDLETVSFRGLLAAAPGSLPAYKIAFVGADQGHAVSTAGTSTYVRRVKTVYDDRSVDLDVAGTPLHAFWAMLAQMYLDRAMVAVPPGWVIVASAVAFSLLIILAMILFGGPAALGMFLVSVASGPFVNAFGIKYLQVYLPLFDSYYFGLSTFIAAGLGRLSVTAYQRWRLEADRRLHAHAADLKANFISLLSHNLNTPVAKMQGMLALLSSLPESKPWAGDLRLAEAMVGELEQSIRCVLIASALEEGSINETPRSAKALADELVTSLGGSLRRLGVALTIVPDPDDEGLAMVPLLFDVRAVTTAVGAVAALFRVAGDRVAVQICYAVRDDGEAMRLQIAVGSRGHWLSDGAVRSLGALDGREVRRLIGDSFFYDVLTGLVSLTVRRYKGTVDLEPGGLGGEATPGGRVVLTLTPTP